MKYMKEEARPNYQMNQISKWGKKADKFLMGFNSFNSPSPKISLIWSIWKFGPAFPHVSLVTPV
jgi:hypothetical protein